MEPTPSKGAGPAIVPCLWFDKQAEEAVRFYTSVFPGSDPGETLRSPLDNPSGKAGDVLTLDFEIMGRRFLALNGGPAFQVNPSISFFVHTGDAAETDRLFHALAEGGSVLMPLDTYPWSARYGWVQDRFGVSWQVMQGRREGHVPIVPCLMFTDASKGQAQPAMDTYTRLFPGSRITALDRYTGDEGPEGYVKHGRFVLAGQDFAAMDSPIDHGFGFSEGVSLQVMCDDQAEVDRYWDALSAVPEAEQCGWLKDRFGVSWQIVPTILSRLLADPDRGKAKLVMAAMMPMGRLDLQAIEEAAKAGGGPAQKTA